MALRDVLGRPLRNLRLSVTDRCNLRCSYCMPEREYIWLPQPDLLRFEEIRDLAGVFASLGVERLRLTGGEPLLRRDLHVLVRLLKGVAGIREVALTTNGLLLAEQAAGLFAAGLDRVTVSLDTLDPERFRRLTRHDSLERVLAGLAAAHAAGFRDTKLDCVLLRGENEGELLELLDFARAQGCELRFIEYMDVGGATGWSMEQIVPRAELLARLEAVRGPLTPSDGERGSAPAERFRLADGTLFGVIASTTTPFCGACDRSRLTADGRWYLCLYASAGLDLLTPLRGGATQAELGDMIAAAWQGRSDRGAEERLAASTRTALHPRPVLQRDPRLEMHTRGG